ncbi:hypothetical protein L218DRAFT_612450 [Marasmius fiardii PR-910]|nr:hypothetical protein L218DRAFT_612450 [Marasmius fiardii PR-910]
MILPSSPTNTFLVFRASVKHFCLHGVSTRTVLQIPIPISISPRQSQRRALHSTTPHHRIPYKKRKELPIFTTPNSDIRNVETGSTNANTNENSGSGSSSSPSSDGGSPQTGTAPPGKLKNKHIPFTSVKLVDPESGSLIDTTMSEILATMNKKTHFAELQTTVPFPVVKLINRDEARDERQKAKEIKKDLKKKNLTKEFQFTWGMEGGDLQRRLGRVRESLEKGLKVDLVFAPKPRQKGPPFPEMRERLQGVVEALKDVSTEWKARRFQSGIAAAFLQGIKDAEKTPDSDST